MSDAKSALSIPLHDIAPLVNKRSDEPSTQSPLLRPGLLFRIPSIEQANDEDNRELREEFNIKTIVNTRHGAMRYHRDNKTESYVSETWAVEKVLGVTSCHVYLRRGRAFAENLLNELPSLTRHKLNLKALMVADKQDPKLQAYSQSVLPVRTSVEDGFAVLMASAGVVGHVFNEVLAASGAFPLLVSGDVPSWDSMLLLFLLLLLLDVPEAAIEGLFVEMGEDVSNSRIAHPGVVDQKAKDSDQNFWPRGLKQRLDATYGSIAGYLRSAGVKQAALDGIRAALLPPASEKNGPLVDLHS